MRLNKFIAQATGISRRAADTAVAEDRVTVNGTKPSTGQDITADDTVTLDGQPVRSVAARTIMLHKPVGYVVSRNGQGDQTVYDLLPSDMHNLKPVGRLDKYSSGLLLLTNDGELANDLTHPRHQKMKVYEIRLSQPLQPLHRQMIQDHGVQLDDGPSKFELARITDGDDFQWRITMREGRNRQIRRTFLALGYGISRLHRTRFGDYRLEQIAPGAYQDA